MAEHEDGSPLQDGADRQDAQEAGAGPIQVVIVEFHGSKRRRAGFEPTGSGPDEDDDKITTKGLIQTVLLALIALCLGGQAVISGVSLSAKHDSEKSSSSDELEDSIVLLAVMGALQPKQPATIIETERRPAAGADSRIIYPPTPPAPVINSPIIPPPQSMPGHEEKTAAVQTPSSQPSTQHFAFKLMCGSLSIDVSDEDAASSTDEPPPPCTAIREKQEEHKRQSGLMVTFKYKNTSVTADPIRYSATHSGLLEMPSDDSVPRGACPNQTVSDFKVLRVEESDGYWFACDRHSCPDSANSDRYFDLCVAAQSQNGGSDISSWRFGFKINKNLVITKVGTQELQ